MPSALEGRAFSALVVAALGVAILAGGGSDGTRIAWLGAAAVVVVALATFRLSLPRVGREAAALGLLLAGVVLWSGVTIVWSIEPDRSWESFNRGVAYLAFLALGALVPLSPRVLARALAALFGLAILWALLGKAVPALGPDLERSARLQAPVGYWNALALLVAMSLPLWLWLARRRASATGMLFLALVALVLTTSRGGILVALVAVAAFLALGRERVGAGIALALAAPPAVTVAAWALARPALSDAGVQDRAGEGAVLGLLLVAGAALVAALARAVPELEGRRRQAVGRTLGGGAALAAAAVVAVGLVAVDLGEVWDEFRNPPAVQVPNDPSRLTDPSSNHRWTWWTQAWQIFEDDPLGGSGAGSYELARRPLREDTLAPLDPHDLALAALSETGVVGFLLLAGAVVAAGFVAARALGRLEGADRAAGAALVAGAVAYLAHALVDMPWQYAAVSTPVFVVLGSLAAAGRERRPGRLGRPAALALAAVTLALVGSLALPALAERRVDAALAALVEGDAAAAESAAEQAQSLNPLSVDSILVEAAADEFRGRLAEAQRLYRRAVELQPRNPATWYELGRFEFEARCNLDEALLYLDRSYALDSWPPDTGRLLNEVRAAIAAGGC